KAFLVHRLDAGTILSEVREVDAVRDRAIPEFRGDRIEGGAQPHAAEIAAVDGVQDVPVDPELGSGDRAERYADLLRFANRLREFSARQRFGIREDRQRIVGKGIDGDPCDEAAIDASGEGHEYGSSLPHGLDHAIIGRSYVRRSWVRIDRGYRTRGRALRHREATVLDSGRMTAMCVPLFSSARRPGSGPRWGSPTPRTVGPP